jgi:RHS repeat-associated protein
VAATNASGQVIWRESYRPYGERLTNAPASADNEVWFTSRRQDVETGLVYMGARYYEPIVGRFISKDPVGFNESNLHSFNRYAYANNNPYRYIDPDGRIVLPAAVLVVAAIAVGTAITVQNLPKNDKDRLAKALQRSLASIFHQESADADQSSGDKASSEIKATAVLRMTSRLWRNACNPSEKFQPVRGTKGKKDQETGEIWVKDLSRHGGDHYEVYGNSKDFEKGRRDRDVWADGRPKRKF